MIKPKLYCICEHKLFGPPPKTRCIVMDSDDSDSLLDNEIYIFCPNCFKEDLMKFPQDEGMFLSPYYTDPYDGKIVIRA